MKENQQVIFMSDGGETVRRLQEYLHPCSEHVMDWFHITMRLTVLQQQTKTLWAEQPEVVEEIAKQLESVKHLLWHGNAEEAPPEREQTIIPVYCGCKVIRKTKDRVRS